MYIGHVGDSRCYRVRERQIQQLTRDHSLINDYLLAMPDLTDEQKSELPKNVITRALGMQDHVVVDLQHDDPTPGRRLRALLGRPVAAWSATTTSSEIVTSTTDIREACSSLIQRANERGRRGQHHRGPHQDRGRSPRSPTRSRTAFATEPRSSGPIGPLEAERGRRRRAPQPEPVKGAGSTRGLPP